jgi:hypothetical protein
MAASGNKPQVVADSEPAKTATEHWKFVYKSVATKYALLLFPLTLIPLFSPTHYL